jgi:cell division protein FtsI (penicillin-binding protein 3)
VTSKPVNIKKVILMRTYFAFTVMCIFACFIAAYLFKIQFKEGEKWKKLAQGLSTAIKTTEPTRGNIFSNDGSLLATSLPYYNLHIDGKAPAFADDELFFSKVDSLGMLLAKEFGDKSAAEYKNILRSIKRRKDRYYLLKRKVSYTQLKRIKQFPLFNEGVYKGGLTIEEKSKREKPFSYLAERTIGFNVSNIAPVGVEGAFNTELSGKPGKRVVQRVSGGAWIPVNDEEQIEAQNGLDIITSIDINLQDVAEHALMRTLVKNDAEWGTAILMEVKTGEIRAIANLTRISEGKYIEKYNYAIGESCEPGSTFKLFSIMALLDAGKAKLDDLYDTEGGKKKYFDATMYDSEEGGHGIVTLRHAFELSSNVAISKAVYEAYKNDKITYYNQLVNMGLSKPLGLQLKGEGTPNIKHPKQWSGITLPWSSIGYEVEITPMQIATLYNGIANNGVVVKPLFVKQVLKTGNVVEQYQTEVMNEQVCKPTTLKEVQEMLKGVVLNGTGKSLINPHYSVAGKTGTALVASGKSGYKNKVYRSSFAGYFPADRPQYTCVVMVNAPSKGIYYGAAVAGPVFKEIADKVYASSVNLHPELRHVMMDPTSDLPLTKKAYQKEIRSIASTIGLTMHSDDGNNYNNTEWISSENTGTSLKISPVHFSDKWMPDVTGMGLKDAVYLLENMGVRVNAVGYGKVKYQSILPGQSIEKGITVTLKLG